MATPEQRSRRRAQRANAARQREARQTHRPPPKTLPKSITEPYRRALTEQGYRWLDGTETPTGRLERHQAARLASLARWGKADPRFYDAFKQYFYRDEKKGPPEDEDEDEQYEEMDEDEEEE